MRRILTRIIAWYNPLARWGVGLAAGIFVISIGVFLAMTFFPAVPTERIQIIQSILSWPFLSFVLIMSFIWRFGEALERFIGRVKQVSLPGGSSITSQTENQREESNDTVVINAELISLLLRERDAYLLGFAEKSREADARMEALRDRDQSINYWINEAIIWEFRYLDVFLVMKTKLVLWWFGRQPGVRKGNYEKTFDMFGEDERQKILAVLLHHKLLETNDDGLHFNVPLKGIIFLRFIGLSPDVNTGGKESGVAS